MGTRAVSRGFPIKVNELREVVEEVMMPGRIMSWPEVGSKAELFAALAFQDCPMAC